MFFAFFINFAEDVVIAWALYFLLAPVNKALSLLASLFQLVYASICFTGLFNLLPVYRALTGAGHGSAATLNVPHEQMYLLLRSFRYEYSMALVFMLWLLFAGWRLKQPAVGV